MLKELFSFILKTITNRLNMHIIRGKRFESSVKEAVISSIHKD